MIRTMKTKRATELERSVEIARLIAANPYIPYPPSPKQLTFLMLDCKEAFYGGAAGGGKSTALLMAALMYVHVPNYAAILFRRSYTDLALPGALMDIAMQWLRETDAQWEPMKRQWRFPSGATVGFGYLDSESDKYRYQSAEFQFIGFDELTQFTESQYRYLFSRLRRVQGVNVPLRMRAASNPGGDGHDWVKQRFIVERSDRVFVPATLDDNPAIDADAYRRMLAELDPVTRAQLEHGDWDIMPAGNLFKREWFDVVDAAPVNATKVRFWDLAATQGGGDWTVGCLVACDDAGIYYVEDVQRVQESPKAVERLIRQCADMDGPNVIIGMEEESGASGKMISDHYRSNILPDRYFEAIPPTRGKVSRARLVSAQAEARNIKLVSGPWIRDFLNELTAFPDGPHDDQVDALSGAFAMLSKRRAAYFAEPRAMPVAFELR